MMKIMIMLMIMMTYDTFDDEDYDAADDHDASHDDAYDGEDDDETAPLGHEVIR